MQLQVQLVKTYSIEELRKQIESILGEKMSYTLIDKEAYYALNLTYKTSSAYTEFMEKLHKMWRN